MLARLVLVLSAAMVGVQLAGCASVYSPRCGGCAAAGGCGAPCDGGECGCAAPSGCGDECGCGVPCCNHPSVAGQTWDCCDGEGPELCYCTGPNGECCHRGCCSCLARWWYGDTVACGQCCEEAAGGCEPGCSTGCGSGCGGGCGGCSPGPCAALWNALCGCSGCDSELYWSEWHNDPPRCCDPCDQCGNWIGPGAGSYRAPYEHPYGVASKPQGTYARTKKPAMRR